MLSFVLEYARASLRLMRARPLRSILSITGIFAGVFSVIVILSIQQAERREIEELYEVKGARLVLALPSFDPATARAGRLRNQEVARLLENPLVQSVLPRIQRESV